MCRLFGMSGGAEPVRARFWLLDAPDSLTVQSHREPDGTGLGIFGADALPRLHKWPIAAYEDCEFAAEAREVESTTFVAHIRYASTGAVELKNTHPFEQNGRLFAHNGVIEDLATLEARLGDHGSPVTGDTDSERFFALISKEIEESDGDVGAGLAAAVSWVAENLPLYAINLVLTTDDGLWAFRYPETHRLFVLERPAGGHHGSRHLEIASTVGTVRAHSRDLARRPAVIVASEPMDEGHGWRALASGELIHVSSDLLVTSTTVLDSPPALPLTLADLHPQAAASQAAAAEPPSEPGPLT